MEWGIKLNASKTKIMIVLAVPQYFILLSIYLWNDLGDPVFYGVGLASFQCRANAFLLAYADCSLFCLLYTR